MTEQLDDLERLIAPLSVGIGYVAQGPLSHADTPVAVVPIT